MQNILELQVVFEGEFFLAVDKPAGWLSVPSRYEQEDQRPCVGRILEERLHGNRIWPVHRLDQEVTGLMLWAKTSDAQRVAGEWFEKRLILKTYEAWTEGVPGEGWKQGEEMLWESRLARGKKRAYEAKFGKNGATVAVWENFLRLEGIDQDLLKWKMRPLTGRPHQIRFELMKHGCPVLGDKLYGAKQVFSGSGIALRAFSLDFKNIKDRSSWGLPEMIKIGGLSGFLYKKGDS